MGPPPGRAVDGVIPDIRIGSGFDTHALVAGRPLILGGVTIPYERGLAGDSDADALLHACADALLGAAALGDLGRFYPPGAPGSQGLDSRKILTEIHARIRQERWQIVNVDTTVIAQAPRLGPHLEPMRARLAEILELPIDRVSVKAKSTDRLGFLGRAEGIAALATILLARS